MTSPTRVPYFLNLFQIRFPVGGVCSIGHRASGVTLAAALPILIGLLHRSLAGPEGYAAVVTALGTVTGKVAAVLLAWALGHHALAGVRHILKDVDVAHLDSPAAARGWPSLAAE
jgi:succinate dehydrogenase / fumarate reductase, cytochrome b subunit